MQNPQMRTFLSLGLLLASVPAAASQPSGKTYGPWHVVSISSLSGTEGNDASLILTQGEEPNTIQVHWTQAGPVVVSINIDKCSGDDDFEASYSVVVQRWLRLSNSEAQARLRADITTWLNQAELSCSSSIATEPFSLMDLNAAAADFTNRLRYLAGARQPE